MNKIIFLLIVSLFFPIATHAQETKNSTDWYVKDMQSTITVRDDSSLLIEEKIAADAGNLPDKHGIFRVVPMETKTDKGVIKTPVSLVSITDFDGNNVPYAEFASNFDHTVTWKIGDANKTVTGINYYKITYLVKNAVRSGSADFDELYWNLNGNFWDIEIDNFNAKIVFPEEINQDNSQTYLYSGDLGQTGNNLADFAWSGSVLQISSTQTIAPRQGITASITFPKNIIKPYVPGFWDIYGEYLWFLIPLALFVFSHYLWSKYGKDPVVNKTIIPEFEIPENLTPMEMGTLANNGGFKDSLISATIIDLAVKKHIAIEEIPKKGLFGEQDFKLKKIGNASSLGAPEAFLIDSVFGAKEEVLLSDLKNNFYKNLPTIKKSAIESLKTKGLIHQSGLTLQAIFFGTGFVPLVAAFFAAAAGSFILAAALAVSALILVIFGILMPKRTQKGAELNWRIKGFKLYMETAEKYRARFNEKENIFEKFLPYAIMFGMANLWIKKMEQIYGKEYFANYHPVWYAGSFGKNFNADNFTSQLNSISAGIAANIGTPSGSSGSGFAGGGGGGGGGGGW